MRPLESEVGPLERAWQFVGRKTPQLGAAAGLAILYATRKRADTGGLARRGAGPFDARS